MVKVTQKYQKDNAFVEITQTRKDGIRSKFLYFLFMLFAKVFYRNPAGSVAGWWQAWMCDYKAWQYICRKHPTNKNWFTSEYTVSHYKQLCSINDLVWAASEPVFEYSEKGDLVATFNIQIWQDNELYTCIHYKCVEKKHCYCKIKSKK